MKTIGTLLQMPENKWVTQVRKFNEEKLPFIYLPETPQLASAEDSIYLAGSISQEIAELQEGMATKDLAKVIDSCADGIYILIGIALRHGVDLTPFFEDVHRANMDKLPAAPGTMGRRTADGGSMKPIGWKGPRDEQLIKALREL